MFENIIVCVVVGTVLFFAGRSLYHTLTGKHSGCTGCGTTECPASGQCSQLGTDTKNKNKKGMKDE